MQQRRDWDQHQDTSHRLALPCGVTRASLSVVGRNVVSGSSIVNYLFHFFDKESGRRSRCVLVADISDSPAYIEDLAAQALESWLVDIRTDGRKRTPTPEEKKEIGKALNDFRTYALRRRESTTGKIYF